MVQVFQKDTPLYTRSAVEAPEPAERSETRSHTVATGPAGSTGPSCRSWDQWTRNIVTFLWQEREVRLVVHRGTDGDRLQSSCSVFVLQLPLCDLLLLLLLLW